MNKYKLNLTILILVLAGLPKSFALAQNNLLQIYLPRNVSINGEIALLRDVAILKGDEAKISKAGEIALGKISRPNSEIIIDKKTLMSRLASYGIYAPEIELSGADNVVIERKGCVIKSQEFVSAAERELAKLPRDPSICRWKMTWTPKEFVVDGTGKNVELVAKLLPNNSQNQIRAAVTVVQNDKELCVREVSFNAQYKNLRAVAMKDIKQGTKIDSDNVRMESYESAVAQQSYAQPYGLVAKHQIKAGTIINIEMLESMLSPVLVSRNQGVVIQIKQPGLLITAMGQALEDGRARECVKVRNVDSQRVLLARVNEDGTVEPLY